MKYKYLIYILTTILLISLIGCTGSDYGKKQIPGRRYSEMEAELLFDESLYSYNENNLMVAIKGFKKLVDNYPSSWKRAEALYYISKSYFELQMYEFSIDWGNKLINQYPKSEFLDDIYFIKGKSYKHIFKYYEAAESFLRTVDYTEDKQIQKESENMFRKILSRNLSLEEMIQLAEMYPDSEMIPIVYVIAAQKYLEQDNKEKAKNLLEYTITSFPVNPYTQEAEYLYDTIWNHNDLDKKSDSFPSSYEKEEIDQEKETKVFANKIGLICPLSGRYSSYGNAVKNGVQLALNRYNSTVSDKLQLITYDSKAEPVVSVKIARELVDNKGVIAIIGPVMSGATISASSFADIRKTPLITPTATQEDISSVGEYIFQLNSATNSTLYQAEHMAEYAYNILGLRTFGVLYPTSNYGMSLAERFIQRIEAIGGMIVAEEEYLEESTDFKVQMTALKKAEPEAIYIPAPAEDILMIAPQIKYHDIPTQLLGSDSWNSDKILRLGDYYVEGAIFSAIFYNKENVSSEQNTFNKLYKYRYGQEPDVIASLGYDAAQLIINCVSQGITNREALKNCIINMRNFYGTSGTITFRNTGKAKRKTYFLQISEGEFIELGEKE